MLQRYEKAEAMASEKPKDLGCADVGSKYRVSNIATTEAQCRQTSVQCTPQRGKSSQPGASERSERHPGFRANPSDTPQRGKSSDRSVQIQRTKTFFMLPRAPPHTYNKSRAHARVYIRKTNPQKMFQPFSHHSKPAENQRKTG